jgi:hypothetical protein
MNKATMKWRLALPVAAAVLALGGCGGSGDDSTDAVVGSSGSITACFTANDAVNFAVAVFNAPANSVVPTRSVVGPMIYNGQTVTGQRFFYPNGNTTYTQTNYWTATSSGVTMIATVTNTSTTTVESDDTFLPQNMTPNQTVTNSNNQAATFVGFETISLAGKEFTNACHFNESDPDGNPGNAWYAPGYGIIKEIYSSGQVVQYNGNL